MNSTTDHTIQPEPKLQPATEPQEMSLLKKLKATVSEDDGTPDGTQTFIKIIGGDFLSAAFFRSHIGLFLLIVVFTIIYVAFRYQCQHDMIEIDNLQSELRDAKYKALTNSSDLTEKCRQSHVIEMLSTNSESPIHQSIEPPYLIVVPE